MSQTIKLPGAPPVTQPPVGNHKGQPIADNAVFFAPPPPDIGQLVSADSTVRDKHSPEHPSEEEQDAASGRLGMKIIGLIVSLPIIMAGFLLPQYLGVVFVISVVPIGLIALNGFLLGKRGVEAERAVTYVGERGVARIVLIGREQPRLRQDLLIFKFADELCVEDLQLISKPGLRDYHAYTWRDAAGPTVFKIVGEDPCHWLESAEWQWSTDKGHWLRAAERQWTAYKIPQAIEALDAGQPVRFRLGNSGHILVSAGGIEIQRRGAVSNLPIDDVESVEVRPNDASFARDRWEVVISQNGGKAGDHRSRREGMYSFPYGEIGNARVFVELVNYLHQNRHQKRR